MLVCHFSEGLFRVIRVKMNSFSLNYGANVGDIFLLKIYVLLMRLHTLKSCNKNRIFENNKWDYLRTQNTVCLTKMLP